MVTMLPIFFLPFALAQMPEPSIKLPAEAKGQPGRIVRLTAETAAKHVRWYLVSEDADLVPFPEGRVALFSAPKAGRYVVLAWTAAGDVPSDAVKCVVVIGEPVVPAPADPFARDLKKQFVEDGSADKAKHLAQLAALYREAIAYAEKVDVATAGDLANRIRAAASTLIPAEALVGVRKRIAEEIAKELPQDGDKPLDAATRVKAAKLFERIAARLEELK
jgi:hypothetical protein